VGRRMCLLQKKQFSYILKEVTHILEPLLELHLEGLITCILEPLFGSIHALGIIHLKNIAGWWKEILRLNLE
jgi:hypothetical protein